MAPSATSPDGVSISYAIHGSGSPALVLVHGWSCDRTYWREQIAPFARSHTVVTVDLCGHGESGLDRTQWTLAGFGGDVAAVVEALDLREVVLVGHSLGGDVVTDAAFRLGDRIRGLVWADTYRSLGDRRGPDESFLRRFQDDFVTTTEAFVRRMFPESAPSELVDEIAADMASAPPHVGAATLRVGLTAEPLVLDLLPALEVPVFAINADYRPTDLESLRSHGVHARVLPNVGHFLMLEDPDAFNRALSEVVRELEGSRPS